MVRFWEKVRKTDTCWLWQASTNQGGYGTFRANGASRLAHRLSWEEHYGAIPPATMVLHRCDNPPCVNPKHLFLGTQLDNMRDMANKGRSRSWDQLGTNHFNVKLDEQRVREIRNRFANGETQVSLAKEFGVSFQNIHLIVRRKKWKHVA